MFFVWPCLVVTIQSLIILPVSLILGVCLLKRFGLVRLSLCLSVFFFTIHEASALNVTLSGDTHVNSPMRRSTTERFPIFTWAAGARPCSSSI